MVRLCAAGCNPSDGCRRLTPGLPRALAVLTEVRLDQDLGRASSAPASPRSDERGRSARSSSCSSVAVTGPATPQSANDERQGMARLKAHAAKILALSVLLVAGIGASAALATPTTPNGNGPPSTVPGSPGDDCSHGNSDKDCRPDPNENGKDCDDHGNARGNEDHCDAGSTTTTTTTESTTSTSNTTTTTSTGSTTSTSATTTTSTTRTTPASGGGGTTTTNPPASGGGGTPAATPPTKPELQKELAKQAKGVRGAVASAPANSRELPFTGFPAWLIALIGSTLVAAGLGLRRASS
jgi:hypothetical protein